PFVRGNKKDNNAWCVRQDIEVTDYAEANAKALQAVERGRASGCSSARPAGRRVCTDRSLWGIGRRICPLHIFRYDRRRIKPCESCRCHSIDKSYCAAESSGKFLDHSRQ
ncbi:MAG: hypothetical protein IJ936_07310, partial [Peptococcaceae bacterium]|nr:hypothetical protein [Peptococcaceae bacterium]